MVIPNNSSLDSAFANAKIQASRNMTELENVMEKIAKAKNAGIAVDNLSTEVNRIYLENKRIVDNL
jgi:hypothetical protein